MLGNAFCLSMALKDLWGITKEVFPPSRAKRRLCSSTSRSEIFRPSLRAFKRGPQPRTEFFPLGTVLILHDSDGCSLDAMEPTYYGQEGASCLSPRRRDLTSARIVIMAANL